MSTYIEIRQTVYCLAKWSYRRFFYQEVCCQTNLLFWCLGKSVFNLWLKNPSPASRPLRDVFAKTIRAGIFFY